MGTPSMRGAGTTLRVFCRRADICCYAGASTTESLKEGPARENVRHPVAAQLDWIANAALGLRENPTGKPRPRCRRLGSEGGLAPGCIQVIPGGIEGLDEDRRGLGIERGHRDQSVLPACVSDDQAAQTVLVTQLN